MTPEIATDASGSNNPVILYPYHSGETDLGKIVELLKKDKGIDERIRRIK